MAASRQDAEQVIVLGLPWTMSTVEGEIVGKLEHEAGADISTKKNE